MPQAATSMEFRCAILGNGRSFINAQMSEIPLKNNDDRQAVKEKFPLALGNTNEFGK
jgi:hypothetical protein